MATQLEVFRPDIFPECAQCPVAGRRIMRIKADAPEELLSRRENPKHWEIVSIKIICVRALFKKYGPMTMESETDFERIGSPEEPLLHTDDEYGKVKCPGLKK